MTWAFQRHTVQALLLFGVIAILVSIAAVVLGWRSLEDRRKMQHEGTAVWGEITGLERRRAMRGTDECVAKYRYSDQSGEIQSSEKSYSHLSWEQLRVGDKVPVTYLPDHPTIHVAEHLTEQTVTQPYRAARRFAAGTMGVTVAFGLLALFLVRRTPGS